MRFLKRTDRQRFTPPRSWTLLNKRSLFYRTVNAACITFIAFLLSLLLNQPFSFSTGALLSSADRRDFNVSDFYNVVANSRPVCYQDTDVVIVDIAYTDRQDVIGVLEIVGEHNPKAVGIDVTFNEPKPGDERLFEALDGCQNVVMAVGVSGTKGSSSKEFLPDDYSYFYNMACSGHSHGVVNLPTKFDGGTIREVQLTYPICNSETIPSMALALVQKAHPELADAALSRGHKMETIDFPSRRFEVIHWYELHNVGDRLNDKVVLIGAIGEEGDTHVTPIDNRTSGVLIHAHAVSTILRGAYYTIVPEWLTMAISFMLCFMLCYGNVSLKKNGARALWMRIVQFLGLYVIIQVGYWLFVDHHIIFDFAYTLLMLLFGFFAVDIWFGLGYYVDKYILKSSKERN